MIRCDKYYKYPGNIRLNEYLLKNHSYTVPGKRSGSPQGITITAIPVYLYEKGKTDKDLTVKHIENIGDGLIPHYYISISSTWQVLDNSDCWQEADGSTNDKTLCIAITISDGLVPPMYNLTPMQHAAMLTAYLLKKYRLTVDNVTAKDCPMFFTARWSDFMTKIKGQLRRL